MSGLSQEMDQAEDESQDSALLHPLPTRRRQGRLREDAELLGSNQTYEDVILDGVKNWFEENQVT